MVAQQEPVGNNEPVPDFFEQLIAYREKTGKPWTTISRELGLTRRYLGKLVWARNDGR